MTTYHVGIERIGRSCKNVTVDMEADNLNDLAEQMYNYARKHLSSSGFGVSVVATDDTAAEGRGSIEGGRFGRFTWAVS